MISLLNAKKQIVEFKMLCFVGFSQYSGARFPNFAVRRNIILSEGTRCGIYFFNKDGSYVLLV